VAQSEKTFTEIMRCYRLQPQAASHVYRSVLLCSKHRRGSGSSSNGTSNTSSPIPSDTEVKGRMNCIVVKFRKYPKPLFTMTVFVPCCYIWTSSGTNPHLHAELVLAVKWPECVPLMLKIGMHEGLAVFLLYTFMVFYF
jgi:hypothetical protein